MAGVKTLLIRPILKQKENTEDALSSFIDRNSDFLEA